MNTKSKTCVKNGAATRDWVVVSTFLFFLAVLLMHSFSVNIPNVVHTHPKIPIDVIVSESETIQLLLPYGSTVADILNYIPITESVDFEKRFMEEKLRQEVPFLIPERNKITVYVCGAIAQNKLYRMPEGSTYQDLFPLLDFDESAKISSFRRRRRVLCECEIINIPSKNMRK